jgi:hypothetical protein
VARSTVNWKREVNRLLADAERHARQGENAEALACYVDALGLVPLPRQDHEATIRIHHGLKQVLQSRGDLGDGMERLLATRPSVGPVLARLAGRGAWVDG